MCDSNTMGNYSPWNTNFYHQYLQQHARMTQWLQDLHQNLPLPQLNSSDYKSHSCCCHHNHHPNQQLPVPQQGPYVPQQLPYVPQQLPYVPQQGPYVPQQGPYVPQQGPYVPQQGPYVPQQGYQVPQQGYQVPQQGHQVPQHVQHQRDLFRQRGISRHKSRYNTHHRSRSQTSVEYVRDNEVYEQEEEDDGSDGELVLNVDAILAFRAAKEEADKEEEKDEKSEESFELIDTVLDENFEFVQLDDGGQLHKIYGKPTVPDAKGDVEYDRESRIVLYGDKADRIAGLETSLEIMFDHINDLQQPVVFPHV